MVRRYTGGVSNTTVDAHGDRMTVAALEQMAKSVAESYVPVGFEHDPRIPPFGRIASAYVEERDDGEHELLAVMEIFEDGDEESLDVLAEKREMVLNSPRAERITISYDWTHRNEVDQADIDAIASVLGSESIYDMKKAVDPISIITLGGVFVLGGIASGFLGQIGSDGWNFTKEKLKKIFKRPDVRSGDQLLSFVTVIELDSHRVQVELIISNPSDEAIDSLISSGLEVLDKVLPLYLSQAAEIRRLVFELKDGDLEMLFGVRKDCRPVKAKVTVAEALRHKNVP